MTTTPSKATHVIAHRLAPAGDIPNHPRWPLLVYPAAVPIEGADPAAAFEALFDRNRWPAAWRNGVYPFQHFHSNAHESLGVFSGEVTVQFGGENGVVVTARPGDVIVLPAGTGHKKLSSRGALGIVGAYPAGQHPDLHRPPLSKNNRWTVNGGWRAVATALESTPQLRTTDHRSRTTIQDYADAVMRVPLPECDPVYGEGGPLFAHWR